VQNDRHDFATRQEVDALANVVSADMRELRRDIVPTVREAVKDAIRDALADPEISRRVYAELSRHASDNLAQWIGRRVLVFVAAMLVSATVAWAAMTGRLK
jgi:vacuolar-type H+-ATPase subunit E/Vma4